MAIVVAAAIVLVYITLGGLTSAIYNEVLQFFIIVASLLPLTLVGLHDMGGWSGLEDKVRESALKEEGLHAWQGLGIGNVTNPIDANWIGAVPAMVFLGIVMMPFYYGAKVRSVPEYLRLRFDPKAHLINAITFVLGSILIAGVNL